MKATDATWEGDFARCFVGHGKVERLGWEREGRLGNGGRGEAFIWTGLLGQAAGSAWGVKLGEGLIGKVKTKFSKSVIFGESQRYLAEV
jgi:hypothetical protein